MASDASLHELEEMKYADLRKLAKQHGIRGNLKADKLVKALSEALSPENDQAAHVSMEEIHVEAPVQPERKKKKGRRTARNQGTLHSSTKNVESDVTNPDSSTPSSTVLPVRQKSIPQATMTTSSFLTKQSRKRSRSKTKEDQQEPSGQTPPGKRHARRNTFELQTPSPNVQAMVQSMQDTMTDAEQKASLLATIEKTVSEKHPEGGSRGTASNIPRFAALRKEKADAKGKMFTNVHEKEFNRMESIDSYLEKKHQRADSLTTSIKKMTREFRGYVQNFKKEAALSPLTKKPAEKPKAKTSLFQSPKFVPKVTSTKDMNLNFSTMPSTKVASNKISPKTSSKAAMKPKQVTKTPARKTPAKTLPISSRKSPRGMSTAKVQPSATKENAMNRTYDKKFNFGTQVARSTPFKFTATNVDASINDSMHNKKFDLATSLQRPITWKAHKGKLKPFELDTHIHFNVKDTKVKTTADRSKAMKSLRADKRLDAKMSRRGIKA